MLNVYVNKKIAGNLFRSELDNTKFYFAYHEDCLLPEAVSLTMPVIKEQYVSDYKLHPIFDMNLPEGALLDRLRKEFSKTLPQFDDLALLGIIGNSQIGRLRFTYPENTLDEIPTQNIHELLTHDGAEGLFNDLLNRYAIHSGISGAQPKVMIRDDTYINPVDRITYRGTTHIVKAWHKDEYPELAANEYFCMRAAMHAKLEVPEFELSQNGKFFIIKRFDLKEGGYLGFEDFCVLNGKTSGQKYEGSYESVTKRIRDFVSPEAVNSALTSFFKIFVLSCIIKNGDAHLKNFGIIYDDTESLVKLAPVYDLVSTTTYHREDIMALTLNGTKRWPKSKALLDFARVHCDIPDKHAKKLIHEVINGVQIALSELNKYINTHPSFKDIGAIMVSQWENGLSLSTSY